MHRFVEYIIYIILYLIWIKGWLTLLWKIFILGLVPRESRMTLLLLCVCVCVRVRACVCDEYLTSLQFQ